MPSDRWQPRQDPGDDRSSASASRTAAIEADRYRPVSRAPQRSRHSPSADRDQGRPEFPHKARRIDDGSARPSDTSDRDEKGPPEPSSSRSKNGTRDTAIPALTIRGIAATQRGFSPPQRLASDSDDRPRRARSPDLFDRLAHPPNDSNGSSRPRPETSLRSRLEGEVGRADTSDAPRRSATKLAPRGQYDDSGRRMNDTPRRSETRDRYSGSRPREDILTSPRKRDTEPRRTRDRSISPVHDRSRHRASDQQDARYRDGRSSHATDRPSPPRRSPSPTTSEVSRSHWDRSSHRLDRFERRRTPPRSTDKYSAPTSTRWDSKAQAGEQEQNIRGNGRQNHGTSTRRHRSPSPARSDTSTRLRLRERERETSRVSARDRESERDRQRDRPARWRMDNDDRDLDRPRARRDRDRDLDNATYDRHSRDHRTTQAGRERRRSPEARHTRTPPRHGHVDDGPDRGHVLSRKSGVSTTFDGVQPPTGPRRQDSDNAHQRSVRGGGWQTVRPGSRPDGAPANPSVGDKGSTSRNGRHGGTTDEAVARRAVSPTLSAPAAPEPARAEPGEAYESIHQVGEGTYGQVFKARSERTGALVALKKIRMDSEKDGFPVTAMREIKLLQALRHENVVRLHEIMVTRGSIYMVFEYLEHDLNGILAHPQVQFSAAHLKSLASQLFCGLDYLHRKAVLHRDLKGSNILLNNQGRLKLADFGLARFYAKRRLGDYTNRVVTLWYRPPELLFGETQYGSEVDMWGAGCIFLELFVKRPVFQSETELDQVQAITDILGPVTRDNWPEVDKLAWYEMVKPVTLTHEPAEPGQDYMGSAFAKYLPESALEVARGLLTYDPRKRWSAKQALASTYFAQLPQPELPARLLSALEGEWHEYESRRAKKKASAHRGSDKVGTDTANGPLASSNTPSLAVRAGGPANSAQTGAT